MAFTDILVKTPTRVRIVPAADFDGVNGSLTRPDFEIEFDATTTERTTRRADVTEHPVESGESAVDYVRPLPVELEVAGIVTDLADQIAGGLNNARNIVGLGKGGSRVRDAWDNLVALQAGRHPCDVTTSRRKYRNMVISSLTESRTTERHDVLDVMLVMREVRVAVARTGQIRALPTPASSDIAPAETKGRVSKQAAPAGVATKAADAANEPAVRPSILYSITQ